MKKTKNEIFVEEGESYPCQGCGTPVKIDLPSKVKASEIFCDGCQDLDVLPKPDLAWLDAQPKPDLDALPKPDLAWLTSLPKEQFDKAIDEQILKRSETTSIDFLRSRGFVVTPGPTREGRGEREQKEFV